MCSAISAMTRPTPAQTCSKHFGPVPLGVPGGDHAGPFIERSPMKYLIKSATIYKADIPLSAALADHLAEHKYHEIQPHESRSIGFVPAHSGTQELVSEFPGGIAFRVHIDEKIIPAGVIKKAVDKEVARVLDEEGRKVGKKERAEIRSDVLFELTRTAFSKTTIITCFHHTGSEYLIVPTTNRRLCDLIVTLLVTAVGSIKTQTINVSSVKHGLTARLKKWLAYDTDAFGNFQPCGEAALTQDKRKLTVKMGDLQSAESALNEAMSASFEVRSLGFAYNPNLTQFRLTDDFKLKGIEFCHEPSDEDDLFAAEAAIEVAAIREIIGELAEMLEYKESA